MKNILKWSFINAFATVAYVVILILSINYAGTHINFNSELIDGMIMLVVFVLSAAITGSLVLGRPILMFLDGKKMESIKLFFYTLGWFVVALIILITINLI